LAPIVQIIYANPSAVVITGAICSASFRVTRSSKQGDPIQMNLTKSAQLSLKALMEDSLSTYGITIISYLKYLGLYIFPSLDKTITRNFNRILKSIECDLSRCNNIPVALTSRRSTRKMNILARLNSYSSMLPMAPSSGYWDKIHSVALKDI
jgi:hypothetical protein